jgi:hypothetical protein
MHTEPRDDTHVEKKKNIGSEDEKIEVLMGAATDNNYTSSCKRYTWSLSPS